MRRMRGPWKWSYGAEEFFRGNSHSAEAVKIFRDLGAGTAGVPACPRRS